MPNFYTVTIVEHREWSLTVTADTPDEAKILGLEMMRSCKPEDESLLVQAEEVLPVSADPSRITSPFTSDRE